MTSHGATGVVGYNVQAAVDTMHHLIVAHEVANDGGERGQLANMADQASARRGRLWRSVGLLASAAAPSIVLAGTLDGAADRSSRSAASSWPASLVVGSGRPSPASK